MSGYVFVPGKPEPQGSMKAYVVNGRANITSDNPAMVSWRNNIRAYVLNRILPGVPEYPVEPVMLTLYFRMPRRKAEPKRVTPAHTRKPDIDKLARAALDALNGFVYRDDSQVISVQADKVTADIDEEPGLHIMWSAASSAGGAPADRSYGDATPPVAVPTPTGTPKRLQRLS